MFALSNESGILFLWYNILSSFFLQHTGLCLPPQVLYDVSEEASLRLPLKRYFIGRWSVSSLTVEEVLHWTMKSGCDYLMYFKESIYTLFPMKGSDTAGLYPLKWVIKIPICECLSTSDKFWRMNAFCAFSNLPKDNYILEYYYYLLFNSNWAAKHLVLLFSGISGILFFQFKINIELNENVIGLSMFKINCSIFSSSYFDSLCTVNLMFPSGHALSIH